MFPFNPASPQSAAIANLFTTIAVVAALIFLIVSGSVLWAAVRFRRRPGAAEPPQSAGNLKLELTWTIIPILLLAVVALLTVRTMSAADPPHDNAGAAAVIVTGHQWWWAVDYPQANVHTANEIHLPAGERVLFALRSADVIHSFWLPTVARKMDMIPGTDHYLWIEVDEPGVYEGACAEFCGAQHAWMRLRLVVQSRPAYDQWLKDQAQIPAVPTTGDSGGGAQLFQTRTCVNCHAIAGTTADAHVGPDLTHFASRTTLAGGVLTNTPEHVTRWLADPAAVKPGNHMPNLQLQQDEIRQLVAYLETLQ
ncbi:MAG TPA: cytochrome c oxidase subunit II [Caldilineaceae bacterium]|nr:cytochrome c oxidase subunit II [Caldilineaceae bacterium]